MNTYTLHRFGLISLFKFGFFVGVTTWFLPVMIVTFVLWQLVSGVAAWMASLTYSLSMPLPGAPSIPMDGIELLKLRAAYEIFTAIANLQWWQIFILALGIVCIAAGLSGLSWMMTGSAFNGVALLSGGLELGMSTGVPQAAAASPGFPRPMAIPPVPMAQPAAQAASGPRLEVTAPKPQTIPIQKPISLIGSGSACDIQLDGLLPEHARLSLEDGRYILYDLSNGQSWVHNKSIHDRNMLKDGFNLRLGQWTMTFRQ